MESEANTCYNLLGHILSLVDKQAVLTQSTTATACAALKSRRLLTAASLTDDKRGKASVTLRVKEFLDAVSDKAGRPAVSGEHIATYTRNLLHSIIACTSDLLSQGPKSAHIALNI